MRHGKTCTVCRREYSYCPSCAEDADKPFWMNMFCSEDCFNIFNVCADLEAGKINASDANQKLNGKDLSKVESPSIKETLLKIKNNKEKKVDSFKEERKAETRKTETIFKEESKAEPKAEHKAEDRSELGRKENKGE